MRYNVAQLIKGPIGASRQYDLHEDIDHLDPALEPLGPLVGSVTLMRASQGVLVTGRLRTVLRAECRRCLEPFDTDVAFDIEEVFLPVVRIDDASVDDVPAEERDEAILISEDHTLDLSEVVRQELWLALPEEGLCRPDCAGLCPRCGGNRNLGECHCDSQPVDPRWAALQLFLSEESDSQERSV